MDELTLHFLIANGPLPASAMLLALFITALQPWRRERPARSAQLTRCTAWGKPETSTPIGGRPMIERLGRFGETRAGVPGLRRRG